MPGIETKVYKVESVAVLTGDYARVLIVRAHDPGGMTPVRDVILGDDGVSTISIEGHPVDRAVLLRWAPENRDVRMEIDADPEQYGMVVAARFTAGGASSGT
jgi:hypothetical protein